MYVCPLRFCHDHPQWRCSPLNELPFIIFSSVYAIEIIFRKNRYGFEHDSPTELNQLQYTQCAVATEPAISTDTPSTPPVAPSSPSEQQNTQHNQLPSQEESRRYPTGTEKGLIKWEIVHQFNSSLISDCKVALVFDRRYTRRRLLNPVERIGAVDMQVSEFHVKSVCFNSIE